MARKLNASMDSFKPTKQDISQRKHDLLRLAQGSFSEIAKEYNDEELLDLHATAIHFGPDIIGRDKLPPYLDMIAGEIQRRSQGNATRIAFWSAVVSAVAAVVSIVSLCLSLKK
jgi:hypothetical protein